MKITTNLPGDCSSMSLRYIHGEKMSILQVSVTSLTRCAIRMFKFIWMTTQKCNFWLKPDLKHEHVQRRAKVKCNSFLIKDRSILRVEHLWRLTP